MTPASRSVLTPKAASEEKEYRQRNRLEVGQNYFFSSFFPSWSELLFFIVFGYSRTFGLLDWTLSLDSASAPFFPSRSFFLLFFLSWVLKPHINNHSQDPKDSPGPCWLFFSFFSFLSFFLSFLSVKIPLGFLKLWFANPFPIYLSFLGGNNLT